MKSITGFALAALAFITAPATAQDQQFAELGTCGEVTDCRIGYRTAGTLNEARDNVILIPAWYMGNSETVLGFSAMANLDPEEWYIIAVDPIGNGVSTSPSNSETQPLGAFPSFSIGDMVDSQYRLLTQHLGIESVHAIIGMSMGGMQTFEWSARHPEFAAHFVPIMGSPQLPTYDIVMWDTRNALLAWERECRCAEARTIAAGLGMVVRPPSVTNDSTERAEAANLIETRGEVDNFEEGSNWNAQRQAEAMMAHDIAVHFGGDLGAAARTIGSSVDMFIIVGREDRVVTPGPALEFASWGGVPTLVLDGGCGHGDLACDPDAWPGALNGFIAKE